MTATQFWTYVMVAAMVGYFGLAVVVAIGGWFDIRMMLRRLSKQQESRGDEQAAGQGREERER